MTLSAKQFVVVIDPGHGGKDVGAPGKSSYEKNINLDVALALGRRITDNFNDVKVVYTRDTDKSLELIDRTLTANEAKGDLFISIHCNSVPKTHKERTTIKGVEVYVLGNNKNNVNLAVIQRENSVIELEDDYTTKYRDFDPNSPESQIAFELAQSKYLDRSISFAADIENELINTAGRSRRKYGGVRQGNLYVLARTAMPSVLIELDYICNPSMEKFMTSADGQKKMVTAIYNAFERYYYHYMANPGDNTPGVSSPDTTTPAANSPVELVESITPPYSAAEPAVNADNVAEQNPALEPKDGASTLQHEFRVQIAANETPLDPSDKMLKGVTDYDEYFDRGMYKYTIGHFSTRNEAKPTLRKLQKKFPSAFIIEMKDGQRIY